MATTSRAAAEALTRQAKSIDKRSDGQPTAIKESEYIAALEALEAARIRLLSAAIAFCDRSISAGQLRAVRELLREKERYIAELVGDQTSPFIEDEQPKPEPKPEPEVVHIEPEIAAQAAEEAKIRDEINPELRALLINLDQKVERLEGDFQQGRINASQYRAIRRHYMEQREVALRLLEKHPDSDRWRVVLEGGKTTFLMQLNEATCLSVGLYDITTRDRIFVQGSMPSNAEEAIALLGTFGGPETESPDGRMVATKTEDGKALLLIPGQYTVSLAVFSQNPPAWQVRALREVHRNFEAANTSILKRGDRKSLVFPDLTRFVRP